MWKNGNVCHEAGCGGGGAFGGGGGTINAAIAPPSCVVTRFVTWLRCVARAPFERPVVPDVYMIVDRSSGPTFTFGIERPLRIPESASSYDLVPDGGTEARATHTSFTGIDARYGAMRCARSSSRIAARVPESSKPYASSSPVHHAFNVTATAPMHCVAQNAVIHSG